MTREEINDRIDLLSQEIYDNEEENRHMEDEIEKLLRLLEEE